MRNRINSCRKGQNFYYLEASGGRQLTRNSRFEGRTKLADHYQGNADWQNRDHYGKKRFMLTHASRCGANMPDPGYGGGRRICPGMHIAERNLWRAISKILWAFEIEPITDPLTGVSMPPDTTPFSINGKTSAFHGGAVRVANPFRVVIRPRSSKHAAIIEREYREVLPVLEQYD